MAADRVRLVDVGAAFQESSGQRGLGLEIEACRRRGPERGRTTRQQHQDQVLLGRTTNERQRSLGCAHACRIGRGMTRRDDVDDARPLGGQRFQGGMRCSGESRDAVEHAELAVVRLGGNRHGRRRLARPGDDEPPALGRHRQIGRQTHVGVRRRDGGMVKREQVGARAGAVRICRHRPPFIHDLNQCDIIAEDFTPASSL